MTPFRSKFVQDQIMSFPNKIVTQVYLETALNNAIGPFHVSCDRSVI